MAPRPLASLLVAGAGVLVLLPPEYANVTCEPAKPAVTINYRGRQATVSTGGATKMVYIVNEAEDEIRLQHADESRRALWAGHRVERIGRAVAELTGLETDVKVG